MYFLSKEFRTVFTACSQQRHALPFRATAAFLFLVPFPLLRPFENMPISIISKFFNLLSFVELTLISLFLHLRVMLTYKDYLSAYR